VVLSHDNPGQVMRLVRVLESGDPSGHVVVQHDHAACPLDPGSYAGHPRVHFMPPSPRKRRWGRYFFAKAVLDALRWAVAELDFSWLVVLSGQDYPLHPLPSFWAGLAGSPYDAFVAARPVPSARPGKHDSGAMYMHARYYYRWYEIPPWVLGWAQRSPRVSELLRATQRRISFAQPLIFLWSLPRHSGDMVGFRRLRYPFNDRFQCYTGFVSMTLSRRATEEIDRFVAERPDMVRLYQRAILPCESFILTILCNSADLRVHMDHHHYFRMTGGGQAHAAVLRREDLNAALASGKPFARKFDDRVDPLVLELLDERIGARPTSPG
jgi:hypothetical protein